MWFETALGDSSDPAEISEIETTLAREGDDERSVAVVRLTAVDGPTAVDRHLEPPVALDIVTVSRGNVAGRMAVSGSVMLSDPCASAAGATRWAGLSSRTARANSPPVPPRRSGHSCGHD